MEGLLIGKEQDASPGRVKGVLAAVCGRNKDGSAGDGDPDALAEQLKVMHQCLAIRFLVASISDHVGIIMEQGLVCCEMFSEVL